MLLCLMQIVAVPKNSRKLQIKKINLKLSIVHAQCVGMLPMLLLCTLENSKRNCILLRNNLFNSYLQITRISALIVLIAARHISVLSN